MTEVPTLHAQSPEQSISVEPDATGDSPDNYRRRHEGIRDFLRVFDEMRARPGWRQGDRPLPILLIDGPDDATVAAAQALESRCAGTPYARVPDSAECRDGQRPSDKCGAPYGSLSRHLRECALALTAVAPRGEARLRFPLLTHVLWLLELPIPENTSTHQVAERAIKQRRSRLYEGQDLQSFWANVRAYAEGPLPAWAAAAAFLSVAWATRLATLIGLVAVLSLVAAGVVHVLLLSRTWAGWRRYRWFRRQPFALPEHRRNRVRRFRDFATEVLEVRRRAESTPANADRDDPVADDRTKQRAKKEARDAAKEIELLLVNAFLEDLRQGYERRLWTFPWRRVAWARVVYPVLQVSSENCRLVRRIEEVRSDTCLSDPLLVVGTGRSDGSSGRQREVRAAVRLSARPDGAETIWQGWQANLAKDRSWSSRRCLEIEVASEDASILEKLATTAPPGIRPPLLARPFLPFIVVTALVVSSLVYVYLTTTRNCADGIRRTPTGECVGVSDGGFAYHPRLKAILGAIHDTNADIVASGRPYVTVVYIGALSLPRNAPAGADDLLADVHGELAGMAVAQHQLVENGNDGTKLQVRILPANAGAGYQYADDVARDVLDLADRDERVVGVIGLGESREEVQKAVERLGTKALPTISTSATYDGLGRVGRQYIPSFFALSPPNSELATAAAYWARQGLGSGTPRPARTAAVFMDTTSSDLYSRDLGERFATAFGAGAQRVEFEGASSLDTKIPQVCSAVPPDIIYYAGRSTQFGAFIDSLERSGCDDITVMAGDAVTQYVNDHGERLGRSNGLRLYYTPLASPSSWSRVPSQFRSNFYDDLDPLLARHGIERAASDQRPSREYAALGKDAAETIVRAAQLAFDGQRLSFADRPTVVERGGVLAALEKLAPVDGASGLLKLHGAADGHHALDRPVLLVTVDENGQQNVVRFCGRLYSKQTPSDCPAPPPS
ncbi:hypothetical protein [Micromonospora sp. CPCC 206061]|uniref:hypothetical protein n=1 Tax=Micromonospora sp. CPCC 206061 TaxID=3122410 RepID=UPI002FF0BE48